MGEECVRPNFALHDVGNLGLQAYSLIIFNLKIFLFYWLIDCCYRMQTQASLLQNSITDHWNSNYNSIMETIPPHGGPQKYNELDSAVLLGVLYGAVDNDSFYTYTDDKVIATLNALQTYFNTSANYNIQKQDTLNHIPGVLFGRYPGDTYDGYETGSTGNPWVLCTCAAAEMNYRIAQALIAPVVDNSTANTSSHLNITISALNMPYFESLAQHPSISAVNEPLVQVQLRVNLLIFDF
jgi:hypothetical protein